MLFTMFVLFLFGWLFFHSIGLALHLTWCAAKVIAALLFAVVSRSQKWRQEWSFFIGDSGRRKYNRFCVRCVHTITPPTI